MGRTWVRAVFYLGSLVFFSRNAGELTHQLDRVVGLVFFAVFSLSYIDRCTNHRQFRAGVFGAFLFLSGLIALCPEPTAAIAALALATLGLWYVAKGLGVPTDDLPTYVLTALCFAVLLLLGKTVPGAWYFGQWLADVACGTSNRLAGTVTDFRPSFVGLPTTALLLIFYVARWTYREDRQWRDIVWPAGLTLIIQIVYLILAAKILDLALPIGDATAGRPVDELRWHQAAVGRSVPWNLPLLLFMMYVPVLIWAIGRRRKGVEPAAKVAGRRHTVWIVAGSFFVALVLLCSFAFGRPKPSEKPIVFYEKGFLNWETPQWGRYGSLASGMFGNLPRFVESLGLSSRKVAEITSDSLNDASALAMINLNHELPEGTTNTIWQFVDRGGTLLVLGDHTPYEPPGRVFVNELLAPTAIQFNFDSAICPVGGWLHCNDFQWHPLAAGLGDERNEAGIVVGASLNLKPPAYPVILGRYGYEDEGNRFAPDRAYLGNMRFDVNEPLGDPVLVAEQRFGRGRVLVFGDTSSFFNGIIVSTHGFVGRVFRWIATPRGSAIGRVTIPLALVLLLVALAFVARDGPPGRGLLLLLVLSTVVVPGAARYHWTKAGHQPLQGNIAYVDMSHLPIASQEGWRDTGLMGLHVNLMRNGLLSFNLYDFDYETISEARVLVIVAPAKRFSRSEIRAVRRYIESGGTVIIAVGAEESHASRPLLAAFDLEVGGEDVPLGHFRVQSPELGLEVMFYEAWPMFDRTGKAEVLCWHGEYPLIVVKKVGEGQLVAIGDSNFLLNRNLEMEKAYYQVNIDFLKALLKHLGLSDRGVAAAEARE